MAQGFCSRCKEKLTLENSNPSRIKRGVGRCKSCRKIRDEERKEDISAKYATYYKENHEKMILKSRRYHEDNKEKCASYSANYRAVNRDELLLKNYAFNRTLKGRHKTVRSFLKGERIPKDDFLWNLNFYCSLIENQVCHYCFGQLSETGSGLDRVENSVGHTCYNVVPCCRRCNRIKAHDLSYQEMMMLVPVLRKIVESRVLT